MRKPPRSMAIAVGLTIVLGLPASGASESEIQERTDAVIEQVEALRGLDTLSEVPIRAVSAETAAADQLADFTGEDLGKLRGEEVLLKRLGLLAPDTDLLALVQSLVQTDVAGYYRPDHKDIAVVDRAGLMEGHGVVILGHEYVHALQDQHFDLEGTRDAYPEGDAQAAVIALAEGDATLLMLGLAMDPVLAAELGALDPAALTAGSQLGSLPMLIERELLFPYIDGMGFVQRFWGPGGWERVDKLWQDPPRSSEQIMHPTRYPDELPVEVMLPDMAGLLGEGWTVGFETTMGELRLGVLAAADVDFEIPEFVLFEIHLPHADAADGWGGDRVVSLDGPDGTWAVVWQTTWDTPQDATEFEERAREVMPVLAPAGAVYAVAADTDISASAPVDQGVLLLVADSITTMDELASVLPGA